MSGISEGQKVPKSELGTLGADEYSESELTISTNLDDSSNEEDYGTYLEEEEEDDGDEDKALEKWNPLAADYKSIQNLVCGDNENAAAFAYGVKERALSLCEIKCPFPVERTGFCWKGPRCKFSHKTEKELLRAELKQAIVLNFVLDYKPNLKAGMWLEVIVKHSVSPSEFYVVPVIGPHCLCEALYGKPKEEVKEVRADYQAFRRSHTIPQTKDEIGSGISGLEKITKKLTEKLEGGSKSWRTRQTAYYEKTQLAAVKVCQKDGSKIWYRGEVVKVDVVKVQPREAPWHVVRLFDIGKTMTVQADKMCTLPTSLSLCPALAYKCCLNNVTHFGNRWNGAAKEKFSGLCLEKTMMMEVITNSCDELVATIESSPYIVELKTLGTAESPCSSIAQTMIDEGLALEMNPSQCSSTVSEHLKPRKHFMALNRKKLSEKTIEEESLSLELQQSFKDLDLDKKENVPPLAKSTSHQQHICLT